MLLLLLLHCLHAVKLEDLRMVNSLVFYIDLYSPVPGTCLPVPVPCVKSGKPAATGSAKEEDSHFPLS